MPKIVVCDMTYEEAEFEKICALFRQQKNYRQSL